MDYPTCSNTRHNLDQNELDASYHLLGDAEAAGRAYERAVELQPDNHKFPKNRADFYFSVLGKSDIAIRIYLNLFRLQPQDMETLASCGTDLRHSWQSGKGKIVLSPDAGN